MQIKCFVIFSLILSASLCDGSARISRDANVCGNQRRSTGFVVFGTGFKHGEFPWMVALLYTKMSPPAFFCGGTLVSMSHVITAAHCIKPKYGESFVQEVFAGDVLALFGAYNLSTHHESGRVSISPEEIIIHNDWNPHVERYDADIAVLTFAEGEIPMTRYIKPICLLGAKPRDQEGIVAGWGQSEDKTKNHESIPKKLTLPMHSNADCFLETPDLAKLSSKRTFCAGLQNGSGVCLGDSGNGFFVKIQNIYFLRGIVSSSKTTAATCDVTKYAVYTDVCEYKSWLSEIIGENAFSSVVIEETTVPVPAVIQDEIVQSTTEENEDIVSKLKKQISENAEKELENVADASKQLGNYVAENWSPPDNVVSAAKDFKFW